MYEYIGEFTFSYKHFFIFPKIRTKLQSSFQETCSMLKLQTHKIKYYAMLQVKLGKTIVLLT